MPVTLPTTEPADDDASAVDAVVATLGGTVIGTTAAEPEPATSRPTRRSGPLAVGVLDTDGLHTRSGVAAVELPGSGPAAASLAVQHGLRHLYVHGRARAALGLPESPEDGHPWAAVPDGCGWTTKDTLGPSMALYPAGGGQSVTLAFPGYDPEAEWLAGATDGATLLAVLAGFADEVRANWYRNAVITARTILERHYVGRNREQPKIPACAAIHSRTVPRASASGWTMAPVTWTRPLSDEEDGHTFVHSYDGNAAYLPAIGGAYLGVGEPEHRADPAGLPFSNRLAGYWHPAGELPEGDPRLPRFRYRQDESGRVWLTTPEVDLLRELGHDLTLTEAHVWPTSRKVLHGVYERLRDARKTLLSQGDEAGRLAAKGVGAVMQPMTGYLGRLPNKVTDPGDVLWRPDHRDQVVSLFRCNLYRKLHKIGRQSGRYPIAVTEDAVYFTSPEPDPRTAAPAGMEFKPESDPLRLGTFKPERSAGLAAVREVCGEAKFFPMFRAESERLSGGK